MSPKPKSFEERKSELEDADFFVTMGAFANEDCAESPEVEFPEIEINRANELMEEATIDGRWSDEELITEKVREYSVFDLLLTRADVLFLKNYRKQVRDRITALLQKKEKITRVGDISAMPSNFTGKTPIQVNDWRYRLEPGDEYTRVHFSSPLNEERKLKDDEEIDRLQEEEGLSLWRAIRSVHDRADLTAFRNHISELAEVIRNGSLETNDLIGIGFGYQEIAKFAQEYGFTVYRAGNVGNIRQYAISRYQAFISRKDLLKNTDKAAAA